MMQTSNHFACPVGESGVGILLQEIFVDNLLKNSDVDRYVHIELMW
jgi:hypothetical protein